MMFPQCDWNGCSLERKIEELDRVKRTLAGLIHECYGDGPLAGCPIIETLVDEPSAPVQPRRAAPNERRARRAVAGKRTLI